MTPTDIERWAWTIISLCGVLFQFWNVRQAFVDNWIVHQVRVNTGVDTLKLISRSDVWMHSLVMLALGANAMAGATAIAGQSLLALLSLNAGALLLVALAASQAYRRRQIFNNLRLRRQFVEDKSLHQSEAK